MRAHLDAAGNIINEEAAKTGEEAGMTVVMDSCIMMEHIRLVRALPGAHGRQPGGHDAHTRGHQGVARGEEERARGFGPILTHHTAKITPVVSLEEILEFARRVIEE